MKYIELFKNGFDSTISEKIKPENGPYVGYSPNEGLRLSISMIPEETTINYFYIESLDDNNVITLDSTTWTGYGNNKSKLEYSNDTTSWTSMNDVDSITINKGERLYMRCIEGNICKDMFSIPEEEAETIMMTPLFKTSTNCNIGGNINSVMFDYTYKTEDCVLPAGAFAGLFMGVDMMTGEFANYIIDASKLVLPSMEVTYGCYIYMFYSCSSLTATPELPATTLAESCYVGMFAACTSLITTSELPATTLAESCYRSMFYSCTSLTTAPELPATKLAKSCYDSMFYLCTSLTAVPEILPATELFESCYNHMFVGCTSLTTAPELPATVLAGRCYNHMFDGCTSLTTAPELPATVLAEYCYYYMFRDCTSLTNAPVLPATMLSSYCYENMFNGCTNLNYIKCLATDISAFSCIYFWVNGVASTGTFTKHPDMNSWPTGTSGIPSGWTVVDAEL